MKSCFTEIISLVFLKEPHINTETYKRAVMNQINMTGDKIDLILEGVNQYLMELAREQIRIAFEQAEKKYLTFIREQRGYRNSTPEWQTDWSAERNNL